MSNRYLLFFTMSSNIIRNKLQLNFTHLPLFTIKLFYFEAPCWAREMDRMLNLDF